MAEETQNVETQTEEKVENQTEEATVQAEEESKEQTEQAEKSAEDRIAEREKENADLKDQLLRRAADFDNYRKRMLKEKQETFDYATATSDIWGEVNGMTFFGMYNFSSSLNVVAAIVPIVFMSLVYYLFSYIVSRKMKKVTPRVLITE